MHVRVKFVEGFKDGTIFPRSFAPGEVAVISEVELGQVRRSGGAVEVMEMVIPNPKKAEPKPVEPNDPQNADNSINKLEDHFPGTEEEVAEAREAEAIRTKKKK